HPLKALRAALAQDSGEVDDGVGIGDEGGEEGLVVDPEVDQPDLADFALELEEFGARRMATADREHVAAFGQALYQIAPDKPGAAEDRHAMLSHVASRRAPH